MAVYLSNSFETGQTNGTAITAVNSSTGTAGNGIASVFYSYYSGTRAHGSQGMSVNLSNTKNGGVAWNINPEPVVYTRIYYYQPTENDTIISSIIYLAPMGYGVGFIGTGSVMSISSSAGGARIAVASGTYVVSDSTWYRIEAKFVAGTAGNATIEARLYQGESTAVLDTVTYTLPSALSNITSMWYGLDPGGVNTTRIAYFDDIALSSYDWIGPYTAVAGRGFYPEIDADFATDYLFNWPYYNYGDVLDLGLTDPIGRGVGTAFYFDITPPIVLTPVEATFNTTWYSLQTVTKLPESYGGYPLLLNPLGVGQAWEIATPVPLQKVSTELSVTWQTQSSVSATASVTWEIGLPVSTTASVTWEIELSVSTTASVTWQVLFTAPVTAVSQTFNIDWNVRTYISPATYTVNWNTAQSLQATRNINWDVKTGIAATYSVNWNVAQGLQAAYSVSWNISPVLNTVATTVDVTWNVQVLPSTVPVSATLDSSWNVLTPTFAEANVTWNNLLTIATSKDSTWQILTTVELTQDVEWNSLSGVSTESDIAWDISGAAFITVDVEWFVSASTVAVFDFTWEIRVTYRGPAAAEVCIPDRHHAEVCIPDVVSTVRISR